MGCCAGSGGQAVGRPGGLKKRVAGAPDLGYWGIRGLAHGIRYQLIYMGVEYNEIMYDVTKGETKEEKMAGWKKNKYNLGIEFPNLPYFIDGNVKITESLAIH